MSVVEIAVNGRPVRHDVEPRTHLGDYLREHARLTGTHLGCEHGVCGACTVLLDGQPVRSCITFAVACDGREVRSVEGFADDIVMQQLRTAFSKEHGLQCGFCTPGMLITARDIVLRRPNADDATIRQELAGNLCRCTGYQGIVAAIRSVIVLRLSATPEATPAASSTPPPAAFKPFAAESVAGKPAMNRAPAGASPDASATPSWTRLTQDFEIAQPPQAVWAAFADFPRVATCLPGAELTFHDNDSVKGRLTVKFGPMSASFAGSASVERDDATMSGVMKGAGADRGSGSRTRGQVAYRLEGVDGGRGTRVHLVTDYNLQGPLAQFSRSGLAQEFGRQLIGQFARNLNANLSGQAVPAGGTGLNAGQLIRSTLRALVASWFRRGK